MKLESCIQLEELRSTRFSILSLDLFFLFTNTTDVEFLHFKSLSHKL